MDLGCWVGDSVMVADASHILSEVPALDLSSRHHAFHPHGQAVSWNGSAFHTYVFFLITSADLSWNYSLSLVAMFYLRKQNSSSQKTFFASF